MLKLTKIGFIAVTGKSLILLVRNTYKPMTYENEGLRGAVSHTIQSALRGHPREGQKWMLNTGDP